LILTANKIENWLVFDEVKTYEKMVQFFGPSCIGYKSSVHS